MSRLHEASCVFSSGNLYGEISMSRQQPLSKNIPMPNLLKHTLPAANWYLQSTETGFDIIADLARQLPANYLRVGEFDYWYLSKPNEFSHDNYQAIIAAFQQNKTGSRFKASINSLYEQPDNNHDIQLCWCERNKEPYIRFSFIYDGDIFLEKNIVAYLTEIITEITRGFSLFRVLEVTGTAVDKQGKEWTTHQLTNEIKQPLISLNLFKKFDNTSKSFANVIKTNLQGSLHDFEAMILGKADYEKLVNKPLGDEQQNIRNKINEAWLRLIAIDPELGLEQAKKIVDGPEPLDLTQLTSTQRSNLLDWIDESAAANTTDEEITALTAEMSSLANKLKPLPPIPEQSHREQDLIAQFPMIPENLIEALFKQLKLLKPDTTKNDPLVGDLLHKFHKENPIDKNILFIISEMSEGELNKNYKLSTFVTEFMSDKPSSSAPEATASIATNGSCLLLPPRQSGPKITPELLYIYNNHIKYNRDAYPKVVLIAIISRYLQLFSSIHQDIAVTYLDKFLTALSTSMDDKPGVMKVIQEICDQDPVDYRTLNTVIQLDECIKLFANKATAEERLNSSNPAIGARPF